MGCVGVGTVGVGDDEVSVGFGAGAVGTVFDGDVLSLGPTDGFGLVGFGSVAEVDGSSLVLVSSEAHALRAANVPSKTQERDDEVLRRGERREEEGMAAPIAQRLIKASA